MFCPRWARTETLKRLPSILWLSPRGTWETAHRGRFLRPVWFWEERVIRDYRFRKINDNKPMDKRIKPFNFMLIGTEVNGIIPSLPFRKDISGIQYKEFIDYRTGKSSKELPLPTTAYWKSLEDVLTAYVRHSDNKFDYTNNKVVRKHIIVDRIRYIGKESNNLDETSIFGIDDDSYLEYQNIKEFYDWILSLKPKDVRELGISDRGLKRQKAKIRNGKTLNPKTKIVKMLIGLYRSEKN